MARLLLELWILLLVFQTDALNVNEETGHRHQSFLVDFEAIGQEEPSSHRSLRQTMMRRTPRPSSVSTTTSAPTKAPTTNDCVEGIAQQLSPTVLFQGVVNADQTAVTVKVVSEGQGWIGFGLAGPNGGMVGSHVVIGFPEEANSVTNPGKYVLSGKSNAGVQLLPNELQTLQEASIEQNATHTTLSFTKLLEEDNEPSFSADGSNAVVWAAASSNLLGYHGSNRGVSSITITPCHG